MTDESGTFDGTDTIEEEGSSVAILEANQRFYEIWDTGDRAAAWRYWKSSAARSLMPVRISGNPPGQGPV